jgi:hypothetical protein
MNALIPIIVAVIETYAPTTSVQEAARHESIAQDIYDVTSSEKPLYDDDDSRIKTDAVLLSIMSFESGFRRDVDEGSRKGDGGSSWCLAQINIGKGRIRINEDGTVTYGAPDGWTGKDLTSDRKKCIRTELAIVRMSFACATTNEYALLNLYASGRCDWGFNESRHRLFRAKRIEMMLNTPDDY